MVSNKKLTNNFSGITLIMVEKLESGGVNIKNYFDAWICYGLFLRNVEKYKLSTLNTQNYLIDLFKIN